MRGPRIVSDRRWRLRLFLVLRHPSLPRSRKHDLARSSVQATYLRTETAPKWEFAKQVHFPREAPSPRVHRKEILLVASLAGGTKDRGVAKYSEMRGQPGSVNGKVPDG